jgi:hypothetical protein
MREKKKPLFGRHTVQILYCTVLTEDTTVASISDNLYIRTLPGILVCRGIWSVFFIGTVSRDYGERLKTFWQSMSLFVQEKV